VTRAVLIDLDGTLVDSNEAHVAVWEQVFADEGVTVARQVIRAQIGKGGDAFVPALLPQTDARAVKRLSDRHGALFKAEWLPTIRPFPRAHDLVARLAALGKAVVIASSASEAELEHYLELLDIERFVLGGTTADDVAATKPAGEIVGAALAKARVGPSDAVMLGDTKWDVEAASRANVRCVAVRSGGRPDAELRGAVAVYDDVAALWAGLETSPLV
jgi:phosphoglycolate phosphatase-like HAD superfamily hydrolase